MGRRGNLDRPLFEDYAFHCIGSEATKRRKGYRELIRADERKARPATITGEGEIMYLKTRKGIDGLVRVILPKAHFKTLKKDLTY